MEPVILVVVAFILVYALLYRAHHIPHPRRALLVHPRPMNLPPLYKLDHIIDNVWLGDWGDSITPQKLILNNIKVIVTLNSELIHSYFDVAIFKGLGIAHVRIDIEDSRRANIAPHLRELVGYLVGAGRSGLNVLVHCSAGISRSSSVVIAYLMEVSDVSYDTALAHVQGIRPIVQPNPSFERQLREYGSALQGQGGIANTPHIKIIRDTS